MKPHEQKLFFAVELLIIVLFITANPITAQSTKLVLNVEDSGVEPGSNEIKVAVFLTNFTDTISRFEIMIQEDRADITAFHWLIDTVGTLIGGWESVSSQNFDGWNTNVLINAQANIENPPENTPGIAPQTGETPFFYLIAYINELSDTLPDQTVRYLTNRYYPFCPIFFNQGDEKIGIEPDTVCDSVYFVCDLWIEENICLNWTRVPTPPYDSAAYDCSYITILDTNVVKLHDGSLTVMLSSCGDVNGDRAIDISDITALISYLYMNGDPPPVRRVANPDGSPDGLIDIADITGLIASLYIDQRELVCPYVPPEE
ncbi:MAG: dockerin type I domain-containing protein [candidate division Zixibacteria bacterium]|nr:dockerin type I domain-containing protein [candidate division Zixibacteria bacterium]